MKFTTRRPAALPADTDHPTGPEIVRAILTETGYEELAVALNRSVSSVEKYAQGDDTVIDPIRLFERLYQFALQHSPAQARLMRSRLVSIEQAHERREGRMLAAVLADCNDTRHDEFEATADFHQQAAELFTAVATDAPPSVIRKEAADVEAALSNVIQIRAFRRQAIGSEAA
jgi:hypothetical protein